ncbi:MAG: NAD(P)-dependent oxidoreductase, partial [bacterium]
DMVQEMIDHEVDITYEEFGEQENIHYKMTPYNFKPRVADRLTIDPHVDLGEGILECIHRVYDDIQDE